MFGQHGDDRATRLGPRAHVDGCRVEILGRSRPIGGTHVEPERQHLGRSHSDAPFGQLANIATVMATDSNLTFVRLSEEWSYPHGGQVSRATESVMVSTSVGEHVSSV